MLFIDAHCCCTCSLQEAKFDSRGNRVPTVQAKEELSRYYEIEDENEEQKEDSKEEEVQEEDTLNGDSSNEEEEQQRDKSSDDDEEDIEMEEGVTEALQEEEETEIGSATSRLAVLKCDWDRLKAVDLVAIFQSFVPPGGIIKKASIFPSDYGLAQLKKVILDR